MSGTKPTSPTMKLGASKTIKKERPAVTEHDNDAIAAASNLDLNFEKNTGIQAASRETGTGVRVNQEQDNGQGQTTRVFRSAASKAATTKAEHKDATAAPATGAAQPTTPRLPTLKQEAKSPVTIKNNDRKHNVKVENPAGDVIVDDIKPISLAQPSEPASKSKVGKIEEVELDGDGFEGPIVGTKATNRSPTPSSLRPPPAGPSSAGPSYPSIREVSKEKSAAGSSSTHAFGDDEYEGVNPTEDQFRMKARTRLKEALCASKTDFEEPKEAQPVASSIEGAMFAKYGGVTNEYKNKFRQLRYNMGDKLNSQLRAKVLACNITPAELVEMSSEQLANSDLKAEREKVTEKLTASAITADSSQFATTDVYTCSECGGKQCTIEQTLGRKGDEEVSTFVKCLLCGHRWKV